jgi:hypothetical protein
MENVQSWGILTVSCLAVSWKCPGSAQMRHVPKADLLEALKQSLRDLENLKLVSPNDLDSLNLRRNLKEQTAAIERQLRKAHPREPDQISACDLAA